MILKELIDWLRSQDQDRVVELGFAAPHSDRGWYEHVAFTPVETARIGDMLNYAKAALNETFEGYKGGEYRMTEYTPAKIGEWGECGEEITQAHLRLWSHAANAKVSDGG